VKLLQSIAIHFFLAFLCFFIGAALLWDVVMVVIPSGAAFPDMWLWMVWGGLSLILAYTIPGTIARRRVRLWIRRMSSPRRNVSWEQGCRTVLSWLDSPLLWPWEQNRMVFDALQEIEPYLRSEIPGEAPHRNLLKLIAHYPQSDEEYRKLLVESYLSLGIDDLDDAAVIADLWDEDYPNEKLGRMWVDFALAQRIDAPWMDNGYRWAMEQGGKLEEEVTRFLLPRLLSRNRYDDLAALVYIKGNQSDPTPEVSRALFKIAQHHFKTSRDDDLVMRVRDAVADLAVEKRIEAVEEELPLEELISRVKPTFGGFAWRAVQSTFRTILPVLGAVVKALYHGIRALLRLGWNLLGRVKVPLSTRRWLYPIVIGVLLVILGWGLIKIIPSPAPETVSPDRSGLKVYHSALPFTVQVAAFRTQAEAESMMLRLRRTGEEAYWQKSEGEKPWYRVRLGGFQTQDDAKNHAEDLVARKLIDNYYVANFIDGYYSTP
jgi:hypothetical protein